MINLYEVKVSTFNGNEKITRVVEAQAKCSVDALINAVRALNIKDGPCHAFVKPAQKREVQHA